MNGRERLERFLATRPDDAGCGGTFDALDSYAELAVADDRPAQRLPRVAAHLETCGPCAEDLRGLLALIADDPSIANDSR
jgi:hypothetical protein